ncbi:hypothetical protein SNE510_72560 [Streptomyces sp. NE5-10]|uniref:3-oxoacyl-[acyl-carrier-protein] synthase III C-terminal domain-containing protein n=1 Tax=Streptomyces sp. NE5-10 TaxID=2759674 RepID=UPI0019075F0A|nr:hypothetical protein SNE510_72560 [Streptomyces sp. NE5-10]
MRRAGASLPDISLLLPPNINRMTLLRLVRILGIDRDRLFLDGIPSLGHCFGADSFLNLQSARTAGCLLSGDLYVMTALGLGSTFSAAVLRH